MSSHFSIVVWRLRWPLVIDKEVGIEWSWNSLERTRTLLKLKERIEIAIGACICEAERTLAQIEDPLSEPEHAAEIEPVVADVGRWRIGRDHD